MIQVKEKSSDKMFDFFNVDPSRVAELESAFMQTQRYLTDTYQREINNAVLKNDFSKIEQDFTTAGVIRAFLHSATNANEQAYAIYWGTMFSVELRNVLKRITILAAGGIKP